MAKLRLYLVCYDVTSNRDRAWVAKRLAAHGQRVQESVFECYLDDETLTGLARRFRVRLTDEDEVAFYPLCRDCRDGAVVTTTRRPDRLPEFRIV